MAATLEDRTGLLTGSRPAGSVSVFEEYLRPNVYGRRDACLMSNNPIPAIRPARRSDLVALVEFLATAPHSEGTTDTPGAPVAGNLANRLVAVYGGHITGAIHYTTGPGYTAAITPPRLGSWDEDLAARLLSAAAARVRRKHRAKLIQTLVAAQGADAMGAALVRAGFNRLATLITMRRPVTAADLGLPVSDTITWRSYSRLRHGKFVATIRATYRDSLDCPAMAGLRTAHDAIRTHRQTGRYRPKRWRLGIIGHTPAGVALVSALPGRAELVYLGVVPEMRGHAVGRALLNRAIRDAAEMGAPQMGLAVDAGNTPGLRLYQAEGFRETRRRVAYFVPKENLDTLEA